MIITITPTSLASCFFQCHEGVWLAILCCKLRECYSNNIIILMFITRSALSKIIIMFVEVRPLFDSLRSMSKNWEGLVVSTPSKEMYIS